MTDILHQPLNIGDHVVTSKRHGYAGLIITTIIRFTPKRVMTTDGPYPPDELLKINEQYQIAVNANPELFI